MALGDLDPPYPQSLRRMGASGYVEIQWIVDTLGKAEVASVERVSADAPADAVPGFTDVARQAVFLARFVPAEIGGRKVRQRVQRRFSFTAPGGGTSADGAELPPIDATLPSSIRGAATPAPVPNEPLFEFQVEMPVRVITEPKPMYPESLRRTRVQGYIYLDYIVDTLGTVEPTSLRVLDVQPKSAESAFMDSMRTALRATRYRSAEVGGRKVRQKVQQRFEFRP